MMPPQGCTLLTNPTEVVRSDDYYFMGVPVKWTHGSGFSGDTVEVVLKYSKSYSFARKATTLYDAVAWAGYAYSPTSSYARLLKNSSLDFEKYYLVPVGTFTQRGDELGCSCIPALAWRSSDDVLEIQPLGLLVRRRR